MSFVMHSFTVIQPEISNFFVMFPFAQVFCEESAFPSEQQIVSSTSFELLWGSSFYEVPVRQNSSLNLIESHFASQLYVKSNLQSSGLTFLKQSASVKLHFASHEQGPGVGLHFAAGAPAPVYCIAGADYPPAFSTSLIGAGVAKSNSTSFANPS